MLGWFLIAFGVVIVLVLLAHVRINQEYERSPIFRLGKVVAVRGPGLYLLVPLIDRPVRVDVRTMVETFKGQELVTKDGLTLKIDFVLWCSVVDARKAIVEVANWWDAVSRAAETAMRDVVGQKTLAELLSERATVNERIKTILDTSTEAWGVETDRVEIKDIDIPETMQRAMAKEAEAQRTRSALVIQSDGELQAAKNLREAGDTLSPTALRLRELQTIAAIGAEQNTMVIITPMEAVSPSAQLGVATALSQKGPHRGPAPASLHSEAPAGE